MFKTIQNIHFVGIGGAGMSGIAEVLLNLGYKVSGSDLKKTEVTERLKNLGTSIFYGHNEKNIGTAQVVVVSSAIDLKNPEIIFAGKRKIPVIPRIEMLCELARLKYTIAVAGTHGKTTTTSMVAWILQQAGMDPTFVVGGKLHHLGSGAKLGEGEFLVAEADESDGSFLKLSPAVAVITNIDNDHLDYYGRMKKLNSAFVEFGNNVPFYGYAVVCMEDQGVRSILPKLKKRVFTYGISFNADFMAGEIVTTERGSKFSVICQKKNIGKIDLQISGRHNVLNALASVACAFELGISFEKIADALSKFEAVSRRLEFKGERNGAIWVDDYGHHPTEINATLSALKEKYPDKQLIVFFQPHRFSRTKILLKDFGKCFRPASKVILLPIYPAGEDPIPGIRSEKILTLIKKAGVPVSLSNGGDVRAFKDMVKSGNVILTLGAGDVWKIGEKIFSD